MDGGQIKLHFLEGFRQYVENIADAGRGAISRDIEAMKKNTTEAISTKQLRGPVRELIVGNHRVTYFKIRSDIYFVRGFRKKSQKTPKSQIAYAQMMYRFFKD